MILGMSTHTFTILHVIISLIGIVTGVVVVWGMLGAKRLPLWTAVFLITTVATSVTGFFFKSTSFGPPHAFGVISLVVLAVAIPALYIFHLGAHWRWVYVIGAVLTLYLNAFVGVVQAFQKLSFLNPLAPTQSEPPFVIAQGLVFVLFATLGWYSLRKFHPAANG